MTRQSHFRLAIAAIALLFLAAPNASADPVTFSNVRGGPAGTGGVDLFSNSGITFLTAEPVFVFGALTLGSLPPGATDTLRFTLTGTNEAGTVVLIQESLLPDPRFPGDPVNDVFRFAEFVVPLSFQGTSFSLTVDILGSSGDFIIPSGPNAGQRVDSYTYHFNVVRPVPEPTAVMLLGTGLAYVVARARRRRRARQLPPTH